MKYRHLFNKSQRKRDRLDLEDLPTDELLAAILGDRTAGREVLEYLEAHPEAWDQHANDVVRELQVLDNVGPARAVRAVAAILLGGRLDDLALAEYAAGERAAEPVGVA